MNFARNVDILLNIVSTELEIFKIIFIFIRMAGLLKRTTGLTGLLVATEPHKSLVVLYEKTLSVLKKMPEHAVYRKNTQVESRSFAKNISPRVNSVSEPSSMVNCNCNKHLLKRPLMAPLSRRRSHSSTCQFFLKFQRILDDYLL